MKNYTLVIPLSGVSSDAIGMLLGMAKGSGVQAVWPNNALMCAINPAVGEHRAFEQEVKDAGLRVLRRY